MTAAAAILKNRKIALTLQRFDWFFFKFGTVIHLGPLDPLS